MRNLFFLSVCFIFVTVSCNNSAESINSEISEGVKDHTEGIYQILEPWTGYAIHYEGTFMYLYTEGDSVTAAHLGKYELGDTLVSEATHSTYPGIIGRRDRYNWKQSADSDTLIAEIYFKDGVLKGKMLKLK